jgi:hypothetical protein
MDSNLKLQEMLSEKILQKVDETLEPIHTSPEEAMFFNILQGGQSIDEETGLREYSALSELLKNPKLRNIFITVMDIYKSGKPIPEDIKNIMETPIPQEEKGLPIIETDSDPEVKKLADKGDGQDHVLVMMPADVVAFLDFLQGGKHYDKDGKLQEFGGWRNPLRSIVRTVATVGGALLGGPIGGGLGNMLGRALTGQKVGKDMLIAGVKNGLYSWGAGNALNALGSSAGWNGMAQLGSKAADMGSIGNAFSAANTANVGTNTANVAANTANAGANVAAPVAEATGGDGLLSGLTNSGYLMPGLLVGGGMLLANRGEKQNYDELQRKLDEEQRRRDEDYQINEKRKSDSSNYMNSPFSATLEPHHFSPHQHRHKTYNYKKGGLIKLKGEEIKGKGNGQDDYIPKTCKEKDWVWDATTVGHLGDGATNAGQKALASFEQKIKKNLLHKHKPEIEIQIKQKPLRNVPCALSNGERVTPGPLVAAAGEGDFERGAKIFRKMTQELRKHKMSKGLDLPPPAHDLTVYYKKVLRSK